MPGEDDIYCMLSRIKGEGTLAPFAITPYSPYFNVEPKSTFRAFMDQTMDMLRKAFDLEDQDLSSNILCYEVSWSKGEVEDVLGTDTPLPYQKLRTGMGEDLVRDLFATEDLSRLIDDHRKRIIRLSVALPMDFVLKRKKLQNAKGMHPSPIFSLRPISHISQIPLHLKLLVCSSSSYFSPPAVLSITSFTL
jgi:hypothetical protein